MADTAFQVQYRQEYIAGFEVSKSLLSQCCVNEAVIKGNQATFLVASSGSATTVTRGVTGLIPARADSLTQSTATLVENHDLVRKTGFNIFGSQGDGKRIMQETSMKVVNRAIDLDILGELANTTTTLTGTLTGSLATVMKARTKLGVNQIPIEEIDNMFAVVSPAFMGYLHQTTEFANAQYVDVKPLAGAARRMLRWAGFNWIETPLITGVGTSAEYVYFFHRNAIGHAVNVGEIDARAGYFEEQDYSWARTTVFMGSKLLQAAGAVKVTHDGSAFA